MTHDLALFTTFPGNTLSVWAEKVVKKYWVKKVTEYS